MKEKIIEQKILEYIEADLIFGKIIGDPIFPKQGMSSKVFFINTEKLGEIVIKYGQSVDKDVYYLNLIKNNLSDFPLPKLYGHFKVENINVILLEKINGKLLGEVETEKLPHYFDTVILTLNNLHKIKSNSFDWEKYLLEILDNGILNWEEIENRQNLNGNLVNVTRQKLIEKIKQTKFNLEKFSLLHTDFNQSNLFVDETKKEIIGVIDWEEATFGDPIYDFARFHLHLWHRQVSQKDIDLFFNKLNLNKQEKEIASLYFDIFILHYSAYYSENDDEFCRSRILMHENYLKKFFASKIYETNIQEPYFTFIKNGIKTVEGRLNKGKFLEIQIGDELLVNKTFRLEIISKNIYKKFREMIIAEGVENTVPDAKSIEEAERVYYKFYSKDDEEKFGVVAVKIKLI